MTKSWFSIKSQSDRLKVSIHDEIGAWGVSAKAFIEDIQAFNGQEIHLSVHSPGGSAFDGIAMYHALKNHPARVYGNVEGIAASAATLPLMASEITMPKDAFLMVHNPFTGVYGDAEAMRDTAEILDKVQSALISIYQAKTGLEPDALQALLQAETWMTGSEAKTQGFVDHVMVYAEIAALAPGFDKYFAKLPDRLQRNLVQPTQAIKPTNYLERNLLNILKQFEFTV